MNLDKLEEILKSQPKYRLEQAKKAVFSDLISSWQEAKTLPAELRSELDKKCPLKIDFSAQISDDKKTVKALVSLKDGLQVETVLMQHEDRNTVCVSSQVGCPLACSFCATGKMGFKRNLDAGEIVEQVLLFGRYLKGSGLKVTNIVFMGMGEPFLNYDNVLSAIKILNDKKGFNLGARHFSISTVGIAEGIQKLADEKLQVNLAISLHAPNDKLRSEIMPINKKYPLREVLLAVDGYIKKTRSRVMFEYVMIEDVNDSDQCAKELAVLLRGKLGVVNLIAYNPTGIFRPSSLERIKEFKNILKQSGLNVTERYRFGKGIQAACGQLAAKK